jgi:hypothetical protein
VISAFCDRCKIETRRCEYYPKGRSRQHGMCLVCDSKDPKHPEGHKSRDPGVCYECDRNRRMEKTDRDNV